MQIPRYVVGAFLFALIWASIVYTQGKVTDLRSLAIMIVIFSVLGSALSWGLSKLIEWFKNRS